MIGDQAAYPHFETGDNGTRPGLTKRELFVLEMAKAWVSSFGPEDGAPNPEGVTNLAFTLADALLARFEEKTT